MLLKYWQYIVIAILLSSSYYLYDKYQDKKQQITVLELKHQDVLKNLELEYKDSLLQYKEELLVQQGKLLEANEKVLSVVSDYNAEIEAQNTRTNTVYKEVEKFIPVYSNNSCDFKSGWVSTINTYISSNGNSNPNNP